MTSPLALPARRPLRAYLLWLILATLLPGVVGASLLFVHQYQKSRAQFERNTMQTVRALVYHVDSRLLQAQTIAQTLSTLTALTSRDFARAHDQATRALKLAGGGMTMVLRDRSGQQLINTAAPYGTPLPREHTQHIANVFASAQPAISDVFIGQLVKAPTVSVDVPVVVGEQVEYVLSIGLRPTYFVDILAPSSLPEGARAGVIAPDGTVFARTTRPSEAGTQRVNESLQRAFKNAREGIVEAPSRQGERLLVFFARSAVSGWHVAVGVPRAQLNQALIEPITVLLLGITSLFGIGLWLAWRIGGRLSHSVHALRAPAEALGRGAAPAPITDGVYVSEVADVAAALRSAATLLHERAAALAAKESELRDVHRLARFGTWNLALDTGLFDTSDSVPHIFGRPILPFDQMRGIVLTEESWLLAAGQVSRLRDEGGITHIQLEAIHALGHRIWIDVRAEAVHNADGQVTSLRGTIQDVTDRFKAELALRQADQRKNEFLAMLAHELRNPLAPIASGAQMLSRDGLDAQRTREISAIIARQARHMAGLVDDLLDVSRVTRGMVVLSRECVDMRDIIQEALEQVQQMLHRKQQQLDMAHAGAPVWVMGDRKRLVQVVGNLLHNAIKFTGTHGHITVSMQADAQSVRIEVMDNGIGMLPDELDRAFEMFVQGERTPERAQGGLGIGLALVRSLVELHGGAVWVDSGGPGRGCTFTVSLPCCPPPGHERELQAATNTPPRRLKVLVVDDNADAGEVLAMNLVAFGHDVVVEREPWSALARAPQYAPDVCLLDIGLPGMDGHALARRLRTLPVTRDVLLVAVTGYGQEQDRAASAQAGFDHHLVKPIDMHQLRRLLDEYAATLQPA